MRVDVWWTQPLLIFLGLGGFHRLFHLGGVPGKALLFRALSLAVLFAGNFRRIAAQLVRAEAGWWPGWLPFSPALADSVGAGWFRLTCYYYRGAYYKAFWADPPACAVGEPRKTYLGEQSFPLIMQNVHRYFLYLALLFLVFLAHRCLEGDVVFDPATGKNPSASASARWCWRSMSCCSAATRSAATRCVI